MVLECWDRDFVGSDNFMGQFQIPVADLISEMKEEYYHLQERPGKKEHISGKIRLQTSWKSAVGFFNSFFFGSIIKYSIFVSKRKLDQNQKIFHF